MKKALLLLVLILLLAGGAYFWSQAQHPVQRADLTLFGNVEIRKVDLGFRVDGRIAEVLFQEGERVEAGQVIARLESSPYQEELDLALAQQEQAAAHLAKLEAGSRPQEIAQAQALVRERQATAENLSIEYQRQKNLVADGTISRQSFDDITARLAEAEARLVTAKESLKLVREGFRSEDIHAARADLRAAQARVAGAQTRLDDIRCIAPNAGVILTRVAEPGAIIGAGQTVLTLSLDTPAWIRAYVEEPDLGRIEPGMEARIYSDSRPQQPYSGKVGYISPEAEFTPKTVQTEELRTRLVYRVRIISEPDDQGLRQGMPVTVKLLEDGRQADSE